ncbi:MAG: 2-succinyl-6-hydroxy-2,4-cyclohexadiene-1-carboxylate synthase [Candidatus Latescibacteria bacterium]|nr:2-succinyl-6-hydroxy-2,4-cyclohexadiene-1-carboxylate synthase [Candidatus Latescibacterota bacterium]
MGRGRARGVGGGRVKVTVRGVPYHLEIAGEPARERAVLLLHGFAGSGEDWAETTPRLREAGLAVVAVDLVGHGGSAATEEPERYTMRETVRDLDAILDALRVERADWLGYSMGGRVALHLALALPARVRSLILESASPGIADAEARASRRAADDALADRIEERGVEWFADYWRSIPLFETQWDLPEAVREVLHARRLRNNPRGLARSLRGMGQGVQEYLGDRLAGLKCPLLLIAGERDLKYVEVSRSLWEAIPGSNCGIVAGAGHAVHLEAPDAFAEALADHWEAIEGAHAAQPSSHS